MRFGFNLFATEPSELHPLAIACDEAGWDHLALPDAPFFPEHVSVPYPHSADGERFWSLETPSLDPWAAIAHMAAVTKNLRFITAVLRMPTRKPLLEAKAIMSVAALCDDRVGVGLGLGWMPEEYRFTNEEQKTRGARLTEAIKIIKLCMTGELVEFHGQHYDFDRLMMRPAPKTKVPIYVGGHADAALRRAAELCDGWIGLSHSYDEIREYIALLASLRADFGREGEPFDIIVQCPEATTVDDFRRLEDMGVTHCWVVPWHSPAVRDTAPGDHGIDITGMFDEHPPVEKKVAAIHRFGESVISRL